MDLNFGKTNIAVWYADVENHRCGYCKKDQGNMSYGMTVENLSVHDYQDLIDRGWRRSGQYCYKPIMDQTCCPQYTIRCEALNLALSKSQKKIIKKVNKYLSNGELNKSEVPHGAQCSNGDGVSDIFIKDTPKSKTAKLHMEEQGDVTIEPNLVSNNASTAKNTTRPQSCGDAIVSKPSKSKGLFKEGVGADSSKPPLKKAKLLRMERKQEKILQRGGSLEKIDDVNRPKSIEQLLGEIPKNAKHKLKLKLVCTSSPNADWETVEQVEFNLYKKYQMVIHNDPPDKLNKKGFSRFLVSSPLQITLESMSKSHKLFKLSAKLFEKYQMYVHNDPPGECDQQQFLQFLVNSPLKNEPFPNGVEGLGFGSFHQQYWIDDQLIAVGVIDILPKCVSSVYFFYDPDYRNLTLGTYGSLRELEFTRSLHASVPQLQYYYMGFYIHSCPKMRYKGKLVPSFLLCPESYDWCAIEGCLPKLDASKYSRLNNDINAVDKNSCSREDVNKIRIFSGHRVITFESIKSFTTKQDIFDNIGRMIGKKSLRNFCFEVYL